MVKRDDDLMVLFRIEKLSKLLCNEKYKRERKTNLNNIYYDVSWNYEKNKIVVDITKNNIFSHQDSEELLKQKMDMYIKNEEYENATAIYKYLKISE